MVERLKELKELTEMILDRELSNLTLLNSQQEDLARELDAIQEARVKQSATVSGLGGISPAAFVNAFAKWDEWCLQKRAAINKERAGLLVKLEKQRSQTKIAFGRAEAIKTLVERKK